MRADVRVPGGLQGGAASMRLVGAASEVVTDLPLRVAALERPTDDDVVPLTVAAVALVAAVGSLFSVVGRQLAGRRRISSV